MRPASEIGDDGVMSMWAATSETTSRVGERQGRCAGRLAGLAVGIAMVLLWSVAAQAGFKRGYDAYKRGDYATARREWRDDAARGDAKAQHGMGVLNLYGRAMAKNPGKAIIWFSRAARRGHAGAEYELGILNAAGVGVGQDLVQAYVWFSLSAANGFTLAAPQRDRIGGVLRPAERADAVRRIAAWKAARRR